jgi:anti-sigma regulatory factor (Ser/Thr protein kinase)
MAGGRAFSHEALFYRGDADLLEHTVPFVREGVERHEPTLVVLPKTKLDALRGALGTAAAAEVTFADMDTVGANPARIIPAWRWFVDAHPGQQLRGIGEPIGPHRRGAELAECHRHELLLNVAFDDDPALTLVCPYDLDALEPEVVDEARRTHPYVHGPDATTSTQYLPIDDDEPFSAALPDPVPPVAEMAFGDRPLREIRDFVRQSADAIGLGEDKLQDLVLAVNELATNSVQHGGGGERVRVWKDGEAVVVEISDRGWIAQPLVGRRWPAGDDESGRGLWIVNQVCDLVQVHSTRNGTAVRLHVRA